LRLTVAAIAIVAAGEGPLSKNNRVHVGQLQSVGEECLPRREVLDASQALTGLHVRRVFDLLP